MKKKKITRREFIKKSAGAIAGLSLQHHTLSHLMLLEEIILFLPAIKLNWVYRYWMEGWRYGFILKGEGAQVVAVCDIDTDHLNEVKNAVDDIYGNKDCKTYHDYRDLLLGKILML